MGRSDCKELRQEIVRRNSGLVVLTFEDVDFGERHLSSSPVLVTGV